VKKQSHYQGDLPGFGVSFDQKIDDAIGLIREYESSAIEYSEQGYFLAFSGGKDSIVIHDLAVRAGVKFKAHYSVTTIDPPELTKFIRRNYPDVVWLRQPMPMLRMVEKKGLPTRHLRWCCQKYKEQGGSGVVKILGVRAAESPRRARQWEHVTAWKKGGWCVNPILTWSDTDVWRYIERQKLLYCALYDEGRKRIGCVGCPMANRKKDFERWPHFEKLWRKAVERRWVYRLAQGGDLPKQYQQFKDSGEWFEWWMSNQTMPDKNDCQMGLF